MIKSILVSILLTFSFSVNAANQANPLPIEVCAIRSQYGLPTSQKQDTQLICRNAYTVEHDNKAKIPIWVEYTLTPIHSIGCEKRSNAFKSDRSLPAGKRAEVKDYAKSGYDIGHIANSADMSWDTNIGIESFILSNMTPQLPEFNRGVWKKLESQTRAWAHERDHAIVIYAGPIFDRKQDKTIGRGMVTVPHGFYKILVDTETKEVLVFKFDHSGSKKELNSFISSLAQVQRETGIIFPLPVTPIFSKEIWPSTEKNVRDAKKEVCSIQ